MIGAREKLWEAAREILPLGIWDGCEKFCEGTREMLPEGVCCSVRDNWGEGGGCIVGEEGREGTEGGGGDELRMVESSSSLSSSSPRSSRVEGSEGGGPSRAQRRDSYLERINDSILLDSGQSRVIQGDNDTYCSGGICPSLRCASQYRFARRFPPFLNRLHKVEKSKSQSNSMWYIPACALRSMYPNR